MLGKNCDLNGAVLYGHWRLCEFLVERGADVNYPHEDAGKTPLHAALRKTGRPDDVRILKITLANGRTRMWSHARRSPRVPSCVTAEPKAKPRCTAPLRSAPKRASSS